MHNEPTGLESLGAIIAVIVALIAGLGLGGLALMMGFGAIFQRRQLVTSWPMNEEHAFTPYENQAQGSASRAWTWGLLAGAIAFVFAAGVFMGVTPEMRDLSKDMNMSNLSKRTKTEAPPPAPAPAAAPADKPADKPATDKPADPPADKK